MIKVNCYKADYHTNKRLELAHWEQPTDHLWYWVSYQPTALFYKAKIYISLTWHLDILPT